MFASKNGPWHKSNSNNSQQPTQKMFESAASCSCPRLKVLLHALVLRLFEYCNLLLPDISSDLLISIDKQLNWALKTVFYRSKNKSWTPLRISEEIISMKQRIDLKSFDLIFLILKNERSALQNHLKLSTMSFPNIERNKKFILKEPGSKKFPHGSFFYVCVRSWIFLPLNWEQSNIREKLEETYQRTHATTAQRMFNFLKEPYLAWLSTSQIVRKCY